MENTVTTEQPAMRIIQIVREFSRQGGVENVAFELQHAWRSKGIASRVVTSGAPGTTDLSDIDLVGTRIASIATRGRWRYLGRLAAVPLFTLTASSHLRRRPPGTVVLSHGDSLVGDVCVIHAVNKASLVQKQKAGNYRWLANPMHLWVGLRDRWMIGGLRYRRYVAISEEVANDLVIHYQVPRDRIARISNGVNLTRFDPAIDDRAETRRSLGLPEDATVLINVGHEFERKGVSFVIEAMRELPSNVHFVVVGSDIPAPYERQAEAAGCADRVHFLGARRDVPALYRASDAFVFPTYYEASSLVCLEAMASGLPLFTTRVGHTTEYLEDGVNGFAVTRNGPDVAAKLKAALADPGLMQRMRAGARATAEQYSWERIAGLYYDLLQQVGREVQAGRPPV